jgi:hypothetical protein
MDNLFLLSELFNNPKERKEKTVVWLSDARQECWRNLLVDLFFG